MRVLESLAAIGLLFTLEACAPGSMPSTTRITPYRWMNPARYNPTMPELSAQPVPYLLQRSPPPQTPEAIVRAERDWNPVPPAYIDPARRRASAVLAQGALSEANDIWNKLIQVCPTTDGTPQLLECRSDDHSSVGRMATQYSFALDGAAGTDQELREIVRRLEVACHAFQGANQVNNLAWEMPGTDLSASVCVSPVVYEKQLANATSVRHQHDLEAAADKREAERAAREQSTRRTTHSHDDCPIHDWSIGSHAGMIGGMWLANGCH